MKPVVCIVGPTATGKSDVGDILAQRMDGEIISADSMQVYRGMDIGTGKMPADRRSVPYYGLDLVDPGTPYSAALFQSYGREAAETIHSHGHLPILVGGTGFYVRAVIDDFQFPAGEQVGNEVRDRYMKLAAAEGEQAVWNELLKRDPESAQRIHPHNVRRVVRALEMLELESTSYAQQQDRLATIPPWMPAVQVGLTMDPESLRDRIDRRVDRMIEEGLVDEVTSLLKQGYRTGVTAQQAIGYKEIVSALEGQITLAEAIESIKVATHRYAKRQRSWFRRDPRIQWVSVDGKSIDALMAEVEAAVRSQLSQVG